MTELPLFVDPLLLGNSVKNTTIPEQQQQHNGLSHPLKVYRLLKTLKLKQGQVRNLI